MKGTWDYESQTIGGREISAKDRASIWVEVEGDVMTKTGRAGGGLRDRITLDPSANPRTIDLVSVGHPSGKTFTEWFAPGVGLVKRLNEASKEDRPKEFKSPVGQVNVYVSVLRRRDK